MLAAWVLAGCDSLDRTTAGNSVDVTDAYVAILEDMADWGPSYIGGREFRLSILPTRAYSDLPAVGQEVLTALAGRGYRAADASAPLCDGEVRVSFSPPRTEGSLAYFIDAEFMFAWGGGGGDLMEYLYRVDCTSGKCAVAERTELAQSEIGLRPCPADSPTP
ncbi:MAG TPA: hypothetical protein VK929_17030 [Longimicrobiales bacterium]|nr:hypothetical protein [Longimicrobiales bacterium]